MFQPETRPAEVIHAGWAIWSGVSCCAVMTITLELVAGLKSVATLPVNVMGSALTDCAPKQCGCNQAKAEQLSTNHDEAPSSKSSIFPILSAARRRQGTMGTTHATRVAAGTRRHVSAVRRAGSGGSLVHTAGSS